MKFKDIKINPKFRDHFWALTEVEKVLLREQIRDCGYLDPLTVWEQTGELVDGHHRYDMHEEEFGPAGEDSPKIRTLPFEEEAEAMAWIETYQRGRRNMTEERKAYERGKEYQRTKKPSGGQKDNTNRKKKRGAHSEHLEKSGDVIAKKHGVGRATITRDKQFSEGIDAIREVDATAADLILDGKTNVSKGKVHKIVSASGIDQDLLNEVISQANKPKEPRIKKPKTISAKALAVRHAIEDGSSQKDALARFGITRNQQQFAVTVVDSGNSELIKSMDKELLTINGAHKIVKLPAGDRQEALDAALVAVKKRKASTNGSPFSLLAKTLETSYVDLRAFTMMHKKWGWLVRLGAEKREQLARQSQSLRAVINLFLDELDREVSRVSKGQ